MKHRWLHVAKEEHSGKGWKRSDMIEESVALRTHGDTEQRHRQLKHTLIIQTSFPGAAIFVADIVATTILASQHAWSQDVQSLSYSTQFACSQHFCTYNCFVMKEPFSSITKTSAGGWCLICRKCSGIDPSFFYPRKVMTWDML